MTEPTKRHPEIPDEGLGREDDVSSEHGHAPNNFAATAEDAQEFGNPSDFSGELESLQAQRDEYKEKYLRAQAECANISKRMSQQNAESIRYGAASLARALLPAIDNFHRTIESFPEADRQNPIAKGIALIADQFDKVLRDHGITRVESVGQSFDPTCHEAVMQEASPHHPVGTVSREFEAGYRMHDRILRPAKVAVSKGPDDGTAASEKEDN